MKTKLFDHYHFGRWVLAILPVLLLALLGLVLFALRRSVSVFATLIEIVSDGCDEVLEGISDELVAWCRRRPRLGSVPSVGRAPSASVSPSETPAPTTPTCSHCEASMYRDGDVWQCPTEQCRDYIPVGRPSPLE